MYFCFFWFLACIYCKRNQCCGGQLKNQIKWFTWPSHSTLNSLQRLQHRINQSRHVDKKKLNRIELRRGGVRVCGDAVLLDFQCSFAEIYILSYGIAVLPNEAVCGIQKFWGNFNAVCGFLMLFCAGLRYSYLPYAPSLRNWSAETSKKADVSGGGSNQVKKQGGVNFCTLLSQPLPSSETQGQLVGPG